MADVKQELANLQKQLTEAEANYAKLVTNYNNTLAAEAAAKANAQDCQNKRDQHNTGWAKNKACHIDTLSSLNQAWNNAVTIRQQAQAAMNNGAAVIAGIKDSIDDLIKANQDLLLTDPKYSLQVQQIKANQAAAEAKAKAEADAKRRTTIIVVAIAAIVILVVAVSIVVYRRKNKTATAAGA